MRKVSGQGCPSYPDIGIGTRMARLIGTRMPRLQQFRAFHPNTGRRDLPVSMQYRIGTRMSRLLQYARGIATGMARLLQYARGIATGMARLQQFRDFHPTYKRLPLVHHFI